MIWYVPCLIWNMIDGDDDGDDMADKDDKETREIASRYSRTFLSIFQ